MYLISKVLFTDFSSNEGQTAAKEYFKPNYRPSEGVIGMAIIPGITLEQKWDSLVNEAKSQSAFNYLNDRSPTEFETPYQCAADGSLSQDPMLEDLQVPARPLLSDSDLRARIYERYLYHGGSRCENQLLDMPPHSESSVSTHADIAPRNILVDEQNNVTGVIDWEYAGWYPEY
ncbi:hypothetical protein N7489_010280 [Penicillium chrysogenum]|uniref:uncharacterized protein n=1 Tax=Penicillium chrysogenum TaxID=5076 RepID=UPI0024DF20FD|nr:uncharacterized protein N7489_010280 [Penicillium chrysogenum]KAJ5229572.1 hypothetical protein N7489_010280 [Penicillium chrysogenum]